MQSGTLNRSFDTFSKKKKLIKKEVEDLTNEGRNAIESPLKRGFSEVEDYKIKGTKFIVDKSTLNKEEVRLLIDIVMNWLNKNLEPKRIIVKSLTDDFSDGQVLHELAQSLCGKIDFPEVAVSEAAQKQKIKVILEKLHQNMEIDESEVKDLKWSVDEIYNGNLASILCLLVRMINYFNPEIRLPLNVSLVATKLTVEKDQLVHTKVDLQITGMFEGDSQSTIGSDSFDTLFASAQDKIEDVKKSLLVFVNSHLNKLNIIVDDLESQFKDGVLLLYLLGLLGNYYIPRYAYHDPAPEFSQKRLNIIFAYEMMEELGIPRIKPSPDEIVMGDLKATMRVLYAIFSFYRD